MFNDQARSWLKKLLGQGIAFDEPMAQHTAFKIGGPADGLAAPQSAAQLKALIQWAQQNNIAYMVVGGGTNLLVRDGGIRGLVIRLDQMTGRLRWEKKASQVRVTAGVGVPTKRICALALRHGWQGMNFALGIPGSLGGAIIMNAGTAHGEMADVLAAVTVLSADGHQIRLEREARKIRYRQLDLPGAAQGPEGAPTILLEAELDLQKGNRQKIYREARRLMQARAAAQPTGKPCAGCFFKNPSPEMPAGRLIDQAGLKGAQVGDAQVATGHANFIINTGKATAADVLTLADRVQTRVRQQFNVKLSAEVRIVGEKASA